MITRVFIWSVLGCLLIIAPSYDVLPWVAARYDDKRVLFVLLLGGGLFQAILAGKSGRHTFSGSSVLPLLGVTFLGLVSIYFAETTRYALLEVASWVGLFYVVCFFRSEPYVLVLQLFVIMLATGLLFYLIGFYVGCLASLWEGGPLKWPHPFFGFSNVRFFNQYQIWGLPILGQSLLMYQGLLGRYKKILWGVLAAWWGLLYASGSKGALLAITVALFFTLIVHRRCCFDFMWLMCGTALGGLVLYGVLFFAIPFLLSAEGQLKTIMHSTQFARLELWAIAINFIKENPFFGVGPMHYAWYPNGIAAHPHNSVLQIAAEWGLPATILVFWVFFNGLYCWVKRFNYKTLIRDKGTPEAQIPIALFCSLVAGVLYSLVSGVIVMPLSQVMGATVIGLMLGVYQAHSSRKDGGADEVVDRDEKPKVLLSRVLAILTLVVLAWSVMPELLPRITGQEAFLEKSFQTFGPRFWQQGGIPH